MTSDSQPAAPQPPASSEVIRDSALGDDSSSGTIIIALVSMILGLSLVAVVVAQIPTVLARETNVDAPPWVLMPPVLLFMAMGVALCAAGPHMWWRTWQQQRNVIGHYPLNEPWHFEQRWSAKGERCRSGYQIWIALAMNSGLFYGGLVMLWYAGEADSWGWTIGGWLCIVGLGLPGLGWVAREWWRLNSYGRPFLRFATYPFFLGETLDAEMLLKRPISDAIACQVEVSCIEEYSFRNNGSGGSAQEDTLYRQRQELPIGAAALHTATALPIQICLPEDAAPTVIQGGRDRSERGSSCFHSRQWLLTVTIDRPRGIFTAEFAIPVYRHPGQEREEDLYRTVRNHTSAYESLKQRRRQRRKKASEQ